MCRVSLSNNLSDRTLLLFLSSDWPVGMALPIHSHGQGGRLGRRLVAKCGTGRRLIG